MKWTVFFKARKAIYAVISLTTLISAIVLSVYISHAWHALKQVERGITIAAIVADAFTAILVYLMAVVYFRWVLDFARVLCLFILHTALSIVMAMARSHFSCAKFATRSSCDSAYSALNIVSFVVAGLFLVYTLLLLTMPRELPPPPEDKPDLLSDDPEKWKRTSAGSVDSTTELLGHKLQQSSSIMSSTSPPVSPRKDYYVTNILPRDRSASDATEAGSYGGGGGTVGAPTGAGAARSIARPSVRKLRKKVPVPEPLPLSNPFRAPESREGAESPPLGTTTMHNPIDRWMPPSSAYTSPPQASPPRMSPPGLTISPGTLPRTPPRANTLTPSPTGVMRSYRAQPELAPPPHSARSIAPDMFLAHDAHDARAPYPALPRALAAGSPVWRARTAGPAAAGAAPMTGVPLRRYGSGDDTAGAYYARPGLPQNVRTATQPGMAGPSPPQTAGGEQWRQLVARAATGGPY
ncbi:hypothetical protein PsYK624_113870 [Phanerochaete sordida]|uniref:Uncharacterized protein n=1 Tax=Phanerochaete sordida TaxID=48140 RepID=A0A9P3GI57_9APHY|nr:hypothetical protein PsYK624_113870 [Phanerochaete sordida]